MFSRNTLLGALAAPVFRLYRLWCRSIGYTEINRAAIEDTTNQGRPVVLALWHDELFPLIYLKRQLNIIALVSQSSDGDLLAGVLERMGLETARGSSSRGGVKALLSAARRMRESNLCGCVTVDGPRGPRHEVKEGAVFLAARADAPIVPIRLFMERRKCFGSWDRFQLPLPFSRVSMVCGDAYRVECDLHDQASVIRECRRLEEKLNALQAPELPPSRFSTFGDACSLLLSKAAYGAALLLGHVGFSGIRRLGGWLGALLWACLPSRRRLATDNISRHLDLPPAAAQALARASFTHNARSFLETVLCPQFGINHPLLIIERPDLLERICSNDRPRVGVTAHFGSWELLASIMGDLGDYPRVIVVRTYKNKVMDYLTTKFRSSRGGGVLGHRKAAFPVLRVLHKKGCASFLVDHNTSRSEAYFLPFLGEEAAVNKGPAILAVRGKALVWPLVLMREGRHYRLVLEEPLDTALLEGDPETRALATAKFYTEAIERMIRRAPEQWFWMHNRWKTKREMPD